MNLPKTNDVLEALDSEINHIHSKRNWTGLTIWALSAGLLSLSANFVNNYKSLIVQENYFLNTTTAFVFLLLVLDLVLISWRILTHRFAEKKNERYFHLIPSQMGVEIFLRFLRNVFLLIGIYAISVWVPSPITLAAITFYSFEIVSILIGFRKSYLGEEFFISTKLISNRFAEGFSLLFNLCFVYFYGLAAFSQCEPEELRAAGTLIALGYILFYLSKFSTAEPYLAPLMELKKKVILGFVKAPDALRQIDIILRGAKLDDLVYIYSNKFLDVSEDVKTTKKRFDQIVGEYSKKVKAQPKQTGFKGFVFYFLIIKLTLFKISHSINELDVLIKKLERIKRRFSENTVATFLFTNEMVLANLKEKMDRLKTLDEARKVMKQMTISQTKFKELLKNRLIEANLGKKGTNFIIQHFDLPLTDLPSKVS